MTPRQRLRNSVARLLGIPVGQLKHYAVIGFRSDNGFDISICCESAKQLVNPVIMGAEKCESPE